MRHSTINLTMNTKACTNYRQDVYIAVNHGQDCKRSRRIKSDRNRCRKCLCCQTKQPADNGCQRVACSGAEEGRTPDLYIANVALSQLSYRPSKYADIVRCTAGFTSGCNPLGRPI